MKPKLSLALALVLSGGLFFVRATGTNAITNANISVVNIVNPQGSVDLPRLGRAIFREQSSSFSLQVPIDFRENGKRMDTNNPILQVWLLRTDGTMIPQSDKPSVIEIGSIGNYSTDYMFYQFQKVPANELSGVVVSLNGKLYCREIQGD